MTSRLRCSVLPLLQWGRERERKDGFEPFESATVDAERCVSWYDTWMTVLALHTLGDELSVRYEPPFESLAERWRGRETQEVNFSRDLEAAS